MRLVILILLIFNLSLLVYHFICEIKYNKRINEYYDKQKQKTK